MKTKYEYVINNINSYGAKITLTNREDARDFKRELKEIGVDAKIIQRKYVLAEEKVVR